MASMNTSLPDPMRDWVQDQIEAGTYASTSDYVRDLTRKDQADRDKLKAMQRAIIEGLQSGDPKEFDFESFKQSMLESAR